jgi:hypothetical protein
MSVYRIVAQQRFITGVMSQYVRKNVTINKLQVIYTFLGILKLILVGQYM